MRSPARKRILFLLKHRDYRYDCDPPYSYGTLCSGLLNSAKLVAEMLREELGYIVELVHVRDNNCIDREVARFRPDICVIEAYWVVPEKFKVLHKRHPRVQWVVRNHSAMPFASLEGVVIDWSLRYLDHPNVILSCNDARTNAEFQFLAAIYKGWDPEQIRRRVVLLPNYYPAKSRTHMPDLGFRINVSCFGAIRPLKNHLNQAVAALQFGEAIDRPVKFHINATRIEQMAHPILKNLRALFDIAGRGRGHQLVEHPWMKRPDFLRLCARMDIGLNVSFSETFSIGTADLVTGGVPMVTSPEVAWADPAYYADPDSSLDIARKMKRAFQSRCNVRKNLKGLRKSSDKSRTRWGQFIERPFPGSL